MTRGTNAQGTTGPGKQWPGEALAQGSTGPEKLWIAASPWVPIQEIPILETRGCKGVSVGEIGVSTQISSQLPKTSETPSTTCP
jgi:hypothetical protein